MRAERSRERSKKRNVWEGRKEGEVALERERERERRMRLQGEKKMQGRSE